MSSPKELSDVLSGAFAIMDNEILQWLEGWTPPSQHLTFLPFQSAQDGAPLSSPAVSTTLESASGNQKSQSEEQMLEVSYCLKMVRFVIPG